MVLVADYAAPTHQIKGVRVQVLDSVVSSHILK